MQKKPHAQSNWMNRSTAPPARKRNSNANTIRQTKPTTSINVKTRFGRISSHAHTDALSMPIPRKAIAKIKPIRSNAFQVHIDVMRTGKYVKMACGCQSHAKKVRNALREKIRRLHVSLWQNALQGHIDVKRTGKYVKMAYGSLTPAIKTSSV